MDETEQSTRTSSTSEKLEVGPGPAGDSCAVTPDVQTDGPPKVEGEVSTGTTTTSSLPSSPSSDGQLLTTLEDNYVVYHCISYLGSSLIQEPNSEIEIQRLMTILNESTESNAIQVSVQVPTHSDGSVVILEEEPQLEICHFKVSNIIFFAKGVAGSVDSACFAFSVCVSNDTNSIPVFQCHAFRCQCDNATEAVGQIFRSFAKAFESPPKKSPQNKHTTGSSESGSVGETTVDEATHQTSIYDVTLELKEDDGKGNYHGVPRDKGYFKLRSCVAKQIVLTIQQLPGESDGFRELVVERCFGVLLSPGRHVRHSDMQLVEMISWSRGSNGPYKTYLIKGQWDHNDPAFESLNHETAKDSNVFFTVAVDLVIKGIQEPIRFAVEAKGRVYPNHERFWLLGRRHHVTQQFALVLKRLETGSEQETKFQMVRTKMLGEVDKSKANFSLNFTSFIRSGSLGSIDLDTPGDVEPESDDDEPQSGVGEISKHCTEEQLQAWSEVIANWPSDGVPPKQLDPLVKAGIPDTLRGEIWLRISGAHDDKETMNSYRVLLGKEYAKDDVIQRDITRTFPANDYFRVSGGAGQDQLYKLSKGYALYDKEVGYCQGISFIAAALLLQLPEEQSFCLLVKIMYSYGFRELYRDSFANLHLKMYQLDKLIEANIPELWVHFEDLQVKTMMFASQWFLTLFTAKFPLIFVFRAIDLFLLEGENVLFQIAVALLAAARKELLVLDFEGILKYFRVTLPKKFRKAEATNSLMRLALQVRVKKLKKYEAEYQAKDEADKGFVDPLTRLTEENKMLMSDLMRQDYMITSLILNQAACDESITGLHNELARTKLLLKEAEDLGEQLKEESTMVKTMLQEKVTQYDNDSEKKGNIIDEYKKICSKLSSRLEEEEKKHIQRTAFYNQNLCETCKVFVGTAMKLSSNDDTSPGNVIVPSLSNGGSPSSAQSPLLLEPLENELAKTKIALAEAECRSDDLGHQLAVALAELEVLRNNQGSGSGTWLWKNLTFNKNKQQKDDECASGPGSNASSSGGIVSSQSSHSINMTKK